MDLVTDQDIKIQRYTWDIVDTNTYLVLEENQALIFDPVDSTDLFDAIANVDHIDVILTHSHFDHICGLNKLRRFKSDVRVIATSECSVNIGNIYRNMSSAAEAFLTFYYQNKGIEADISSMVASIGTFTCEPADMTFDDDLNFTWCNHSVELIRCFGHSIDSLIALLDGKYLFSGDTLLNIPTTTRFIGGSTAKFWDKDYPMLKGMSSSVEIVFPGHGEAGSISDMLSVNVMPERYRGKDNKN